MPRKVEMWLNTIRARLVRGELFRLPISAIRLALCSGLSLIVILLVGLTKYPPVVADESPPPVIVAQGSDGRTQCLFNAYLMKLNDFNFVDSTFSITIWLSANCNAPDAPGVETLDFPSAKKFTFQNTITQKVPDGIYINTKLEGTFTQNWDLENYPFDRHTLTIFWENGEEEDISKLVFEPDLNNSGIHPTFELEDGWRITKFTIDPGITRYKTNFGNPLIRTLYVDYSKIIIAFDIERISYLSFSKLVAGVYIAFIISALCTLLDMSENELFTASLGVLVACLFAVFVNLQVAESVLGTVEGLTLVDKIHIMTMFFIVIVCVLQTVFHVFYKHENNLKLQRIERLGFRGLIVFYLLINMLLITSAYLAG